MYIFRPKKKRWNIPKFIFAFQTVSCHSLVMWPVPQARDRSRPAHRAVPSVWPSTTSCDLSICVGFWARMWLAKWIWWQLLIVLFFPFFLLTFRKVVKEAKNSSQSLRLLIFCWNNMFLIPVTNHGANQPQMIHCWALWQACWGRVSSFVFRWTRRCSQKKSSDLLWSRKRTIWHPYSRLKFPKKTPA